MFVMSFLWSLGGSKHSFVGMGDMPLLYMLSAFQFKNSMSHSLLNPEVSPLLVTRVAGSCIIACGNTVCQLYAILVQLL